LKRILSESFRAAGREFSRNSAAPRSNISNFVLESAADIAVQALADLKRAFSDPLFFRAVRLSGRRLGPKTISSS
jgi:hypothetical protein